ncbi:MAG TPA: hypothetical protein VNN80_32695, partial [Polyangiaceae bacterium]|nr:hypothetical protein [Polyangiaceae bacterium]
PGAYRLVRALVDARLLAERTPGRLSVAPEFLKYAALAQARHALVRASPFAWGEALLRPHAAPSVLEALFVCVSGDDFSPLEQLAELDVPSHPALVVAAEAAIVCLGLRALSGADVPIELLTTLLGEQLGVLVELPSELPRPRLLAAGPADACPFALHGVWLLAVLAASEAAGDARSSHPLLCPWSREHAPEGLLPLLDAIDAALARPEVAARPWAVEAYAIAGRLLESTPADDEDVADALEPTASPVSPHPLGRPARLAQALLAGDIPAAWLRGFGERPLELRALQAACALRGISWPRMAHGLWKSWQGGGCPVDAELAFAPAGPLREQLWPHLPPEVLSAAWGRWVAADVAWPFECFGASQWATFVALFAERWRRAPRSAIWRAAFERMDLAHLSLAVEMGRLLGPDPDRVAEPLLTSACRRYPGWLSAKVRESAAGADASTLGLLLRAAPQQLEDELVRVLSEELSRRSTQRAVMDVARAWLHGLLSARRADFRRVYALFVELEQRLARASRARGP